MKIPQLRRLIALADIQAGQVNRFEEPGFINYQVQFFPGKGESVIYQQDGLGVANEKAISELIVEAVLALPGLLDEVEELRQTLAQAETAFGSAEMTDHRPDPPPDLVQLSTLPAGTWMGRRVWHPMTQIGDVPCWREEDVPEAYRDPECEDPSAYQFDTGIVFGAEHDHALGRPEVWFRSGTDSALHYGATNLWTVLLPEETS